MNPYVEISWLEIGFPWVMLCLIGFHLWRRRPTDRSDGVLILARSLFTAVLFSIGVVSTFYQGLLPLRVWPPNGIFDQVLVASNGDVYAKLEDPILQRTSRIQRYDSQGVFQAAFVPDNAGGMFKIVLDPEGRLEVYSVRTDSIDIFSPEGTFLHRTTMDSTDMPFEFLREGPSVLENGGFRYGINPATQRPAIFSLRDQSYSELQAGDWIAETLFSRRNILGAAILGALLLVIVYVREQFVTKSHAV